MVSFTTTVKDEICQKNFKPCCQKTLLSVYTLINGKIISQQCINSEIIVHSFHNRTTRLVYKFFKNQYPDISLKIIVDVLHKFERPKVYNIHINNNVDFIINDLMFLDKHLYIDKEKTQQHLVKDHCIRAYIAGIFLVVGSINSPSTSNYHLELQFSDDLLAKKIKKILLQNFKLTFKSIKRRNKTVLYLKKSNAISDFLKIIDCPQAVFAFEDKRISRELFNNINRFNNIDISNQQKSLNAANQQVEMINFLKDKKVFSELSLKTQTISNLRLQNPEVSLLELCDLYHEATGFVITKSGVNHLIREIKKKYQESL
ncbi:DNA-binding protein WhiA [Spiroplasma endosymbiont of Nebria brevicollis]|uniref:DNA-binding protein WhiA n=1 Tax=Spiroplasma endosymbiont of Nebria brevicollis TaxID=3066284 RepID=UPI00313BB6C0